MPEFELGSTNGNGSHDAVVEPRERAGLSADQIRLELDDYAHQMQTYRAMDPEEVFRSLSGITSRLTEIRLNAMRSTARRAAALRCEIDALLEEADRQFRLHSRLHATRSFDWDVSGRGQT